MLLQKIFTVILSPFKKLNSVVLFPALIVSCYFVYPTWNHLHISQPWLTLVSWAYLLSVAVFLGCSKVLNNDSEKRKNVESGDGIDKYPKVKVCLIILFTTYFCCHLYFIQWPILTGPDESVHAYNQVVQWLAILPYPIKFRITILGICVAIIILIIMIARNLDLSSSKTKLFYRSIWHYFALFVFLLGLLFYYFSTADMLLEHSRGPIWGGEKRWPPLGTLFSILSLLLFGIEEATMRFQSVLFSLGVGVYLYRIIVDEFDPYVAILAVVMCFASPVFFHLWALGL